MRKVLQGTMNAAGKRVEIVASRFNEFITTKLIEGAVDTLVRHGVQEEQIEIVWVPGAFEIPAVARRLAKKRKQDAIICLGCVIRGDTPHFDYIAAEASKGIASVGFESDIPVVFGVLTTDNIEQAIERAGTKAGNKGADAASAAIELMSLYQQIA
jgi:6,7-dimethyl-8-ribityllumazine synthase